MSIFHLKRLSTNPLQKRLLDSKTWLVETGILGILMDSDIKTYSKELDYTLFAKSAILLLVQHTAKIIKNLQKEP